MEQTLREFLFDLYGQPTNGTLRRPDGTLVAKCEHEVWELFPYGEEMGAYMLGTGRGMPSKLCERDLTNPGHGSALSANAGAHSKPIGTGESFDDFAYRMSVVQDARAASSVKWNKKYR